MRYVDRRRAEILAEREKGTPLRVIGKRFGVSFQRVQQIAKKEPGPAASRVVPATPESLRHIARCLYLAWMPNFALTVHDAADKLEKLMQSHSQDTSR